MSDSGYVWWRDMAALSAVNAGMPQQPGSPLNGGGDPETGYRPGPPRDPWWVLLVAVGVLLAAVGTAGAVVFGGFLAGS